MERIHEEQWPQNQDLVKQKYKTVKFCMETHQVYHQATFNGCIHISNATGVDRGSLPPY